MPIPLMTHHTLKKTLFRARVMMRDDGEIEKMHYHLCYRRGNIISESNDLGYRGHTTSGELCSVVPSGW